MMKAYQLKMAVKNVKPPVWKRCLIPAGITFSQLSIMLEEIMELQDSDQYEIEFFQRKIHIREWRGEKKAIIRYNFDYMCASDTYIDLLLEEEEWFTFRVKNAAEYRVTIEKCISETEFSYPSIIKQKENANYCAWSEIGKKNQELKCRFFVHYGDADYRSHSEIRNDLESGNLGFQGSHDAISREEHNKKSCESLLKEFSELIMGTHMKGLVDDAASKMINQKTGDAVADEKMALEILEETKTKMEEEIYQKIFGGVREEKKKRNPTEKQYLMSCNRKELNMIAEEIHLLRYKSLKKEELAEKIKNELLKPSFMQERLLLLSDKTIDVFEEVIQKDYCYRPSNEALELLEPLYDMAYLVIYTDNCVEVPKEVAAVYQQINTPEYRLMRKRVSWMYRCLRMVEMLYVVAPIKIVRQIYRRHPECKVSYEELLEIFKLVPEDMNPCVIRDDKVIYKAVLKNDLYMQLEQRQEGKEFYIPSKEEIEDYAEHGYPSEDLPYQRLRAFLRYQMQLEDEYVDELMPVLWNHISMGADFSDIMDIINEDDITFSSDKDFEEFAFIIMEANNNTRMWINRGHTPKEIASKRPVSDGKMPTIVPMSSMAADMLKESQDELDRRGFSVDYDANADEIPMMFMPEGTAGKTVVSSKKIYPNDPCPCGSGKKYKKCCGRK